MSNKAPFTIEKIGWYDITERQRDFFCFEDDYLPLPKEYALQIHLLTSSSAQRVREWLSSSLPSGWPASEQRFAKRTSFKLDDEHWNLDSGIQIVRQWLHDLGIPYSTDIFLIYEADKIVQMPWKLVVKYWNALAWSIGNYMLAMDCTRQWACCFHHEDVIIFGTFSKKTGKK